MPLSGDDFAVLAGLLIASVIYLVHAYPLSSEAIARRLARSGTEPARAHSQAALRKRIAGGGLLGLGAIALGWALLKAPPDWFSPDRPLRQLMWTLAITLPALPFVVRSAASANSQAQYPEDRATSWDGPAARRSLAAWAFYLLGYELFFRGFLTLQLALWIGVWPALAMGTAIYALTHLRKGASEAFACIPMGLAFGLAAIQTGAIYAPWLAHVMFACVTETLCARYNPDVRYPL
jgi:membrane protease YdiL (CAAX protease family)